jgi:periplasmic protein TonB
MFPALPVTRGEGFEGHGERSRRAVVARTLGMGLDQKAIGAVRQWRFEPALRERQPVAVVVNIEVNIRLY